MRGHRFPNRFSKKEYPIAEAAPVGGAAFSYARRQPNPEVRPVRPCAPPCRPLPRRVGKLPHPHGQHRCGAFVPGVCRGQKFAHQGGGGGSIFEQDKARGSSPLTRAAHTAPQRGSGNISAGVRISPLGSAWGSGGRKSPVWSHLYGFQAGIWRKEGDLQCQEKRSNLPCVFPRRRRNS